MKGGGKNLNLKGKEIGHCQQTGVCPRSGNVDVNRRDVMRPKGKNTGRDNWNLGRSLR